MRTCDPGELAPPSVRGGPARAFTTDPLNFGAADPVALRDGAKIDR